MADQKKVILYINQFFGQIGGEEAANAEPAVRTELSGVGLELNKRISPECSVVAVVTAGDNYMAQDPEKSAAAVVELLKDIDFDILVAGPAFTSGRYGMACGAVAKAAAELLGKKTLASMNEENPGTEMYKADTYIIPSGKNAADMRKSLDKLAIAVKKTAAGEKLSLKDGDYIAQGRRVSVLREKRGCVRAFDMLIKKMAGEPFETELPMPKFDRVAPAPAVKDITKATVVLVSTGGVVPKGNPDRMPSFNANSWAMADISGIDNFVGGEWEQVHGGYDGTFVNDDPDRVVPLDALVDFEKEGLIGKVYRQYLYTVGNITSLDNSRKFGREIAEYMRNNQIDAAIMTST